MNSLADLNRLYIKLYKQLRHYIWSLDTVEALAQLEVAIYQRFPNIHDIRSKFNRLASYVKVSDAYAEDEDLRNEFKDCETSLNEFKDFYAPLQAVAETYPNNPEKEEEENENNTEQNSEELDTSSEPEEHRRGNVIHKHIRH